MRRPVIGSVLGPVWVGADDPLPQPDFVAAPDGLIAVGADLSADRLEEAYRKGLFPWSSDPRHQLWWSPDPRMVLMTAGFEPQRSLRKTLRRLRREQAWQITLDRCFEDVMRACAAPRADAAGTWISPELITAYCELHRRGKAHSVEVWNGDALVGGLYGVSIGRMFYGESMFSRATDASKCAFAATMLQLRSLGMPMVDCQQETAHLTSLGARLIGRNAFLEHLRAACDLPSPDWSGVRLEWPDL